MICSSVNLDRFIARLLFQRTHGAGSLGKEVSEAKRLSTLEEENARLKKLLAELTADVSTLRAMLGKDF